jgi:DNA-binding CsgD family transcriptional regulator
VSPTTVDSHIRSAMERLGARNRVHAVALALARGEVALADGD